MDNSVSPTIRVEVWARGRQAAADTGLAEVF